MRNVAASVRNKLLVMSKEQGADFGRMLGRYTIERLLFRLSQHHSNNSFVLKGATLFATWPERAFRPTGDLDLLGYGSPDPNQMKQLFWEICGIADETDGIAFDPASVTAEPVREDQEYSGLTIRGSAQLDSAVIPLQVDIGFGDLVFPEKRRITFPCLIVGMRAPVIYAYPPETVVAEKFEAMARFGEAMSRLKDFYDVWTISKTFGFQKVALMQAIQGTFQRRNTFLGADMPIALTDVFARHPEKLKAWDGFLRRNRPTIAPPPFDIVLAELRQFLGPVLASLSLPPEGVVGNWDAVTGWSA